MAGMFQPKRVVVPGLLSDEGLAVRVKELTGQIKTDAAAAPPNLSAVDAADRVATEALKPSPTVQAAPKRTPGVELSAGASGAQGAEPPRVGFGGTLLDFKPADAIVKAGTLSPEDQLTEQKAIIAEAQGGVEAAEASATARDNLAALLDRGRSDADKFDTPEDALARTAASARDFGKAQEAVTLAQKTPPTQAWWLNAMQVAARSAAQTGTGALRYPADVYDVLAAIEKGSDVVKKSDMSLWVDNVDKALNQMLPGDKARSKQFVTELASGAGSMVGFLVTGWAGRAVGLPAALTTGVLGAAVEGDSLYKEAETFNATATQKLIALFAGSALGVTEAVPIDRMFMRADTASGGMIRELLAATTASTLEEFIQEASQSMGEDLIAKYGAAYDPNRELDVNSWLRAGAVGGITGGVAGAATTLLRSTGEEMDPVKLDETQQTEMVDAALAEEDRRFAAIVGTDLGDGPAVDGEGAVAPPAQGESAGAPAGGQTAAARPAAVTVDQPRGDAVQQVVEQQAAFHGTPHRFDKFSMEKIGTGEGAQAFGHGLYFAGNRAVAEGYRKNLTRASSPLNDTVQYWLDRSAGNWADARQAYVAFAQESVPRFDAATDEVAQLLQAGPPGALYQVDIPDDAELLDWDAPLSAQPEGVRSALAKVAKGLKKPLFDDIRRFSVERVQDMVAEGTATGEDIYGALSLLDGPGRQDDARASRLLKEAGLPGLRYLDAGSRVDGDGTRNYVIFDDSRITITDVEAQQADLVTPDTMVAAADPTPNLDPLPGATGKPDAKAVSAAMAYSAATGLPITRQTAMAPVSDVDAQLPYLRQEDILASDPEYGAMLAEWQRLTDALNDTAQYESDLQALEAAGNAGNPGNRSAEYKAVARAQGDRNRALLEKRDPLDAEIRRRQAVAKQQAADRRLARADRGAQPTPVEARLSSLYDEMLDQPTDPAVVSSYNALVEEVRAQYLFAVAANGGDLPPNPDAPVYGPDHPLAPVADQFWSLYRFFGTGLEGATDPENMWQAYARVFSASARPAFTTETRGPTGWEAVHGEPPPRKVGLMRSTAWDYNLETEQIERAVALSPTILRDVEVGALNGLSREQMRMMNRMVDDKEWRIVDLPVGRLIGTQLTVNDDFRDAAARRPDDHPLVVRVNGVNYLRDGHHRTAAAQAAGAYTIKARFVDVDRALAPDVEDMPRLDLMTGTATVRQPFIGEPTRPTKGIPTPANATASDEDVRLTAIAKQFRDLFNLTARHGRLAARDSSVMGEYNRRTAAIRLRTWTDLSTLVHEGAHAINDSQSAVVDAFVQRNLLTVKKIARTVYAGDLSQAPDETLRREGFAEFFRVYVLNPAFATNKWPALVNDFEATLRGVDPKLLDGLGVITNKFQAWLNLPSRQLIRNMIVDGRREQGINAAIKELKDQGFKTWMQEHARRTTTWLVNRYAAVAQLEAELLNVGEQNQGRAIDLKRSESPTAIMRLARNSGSRAQVEITDGVIGYRGTQSMSRGLRDALMISQNIDPGTTPGALDEELLKDFDAYLVARRAFDEFRRFEAGDIERPPIGAQKGDVIRAIKEYEQTQPQFVQAAQIVNDYGMAMWQKRYDAGLMDKETYEEGLTRKFYAPLQRDVSDKQGSGADSLRFGSSVLTQGPRFRGSDRDIISPMTVLMQMTFALERQIAENDAKRALAILADRAGQAGALVERIPASQLIGQTFSVKQVASRLTGDADLTASEASDLMTILSGSIEQGDMMTLFRSEQAGAQGENVIFFWENGKVAAIRLNDTSLAADVVNTMNAVGRENMEPWAELLAGTSTVFRTAITSWPDFLLVNYIRDQFSAWILGGTNYVPFATGIGGIRDELRQRDWAKSYNAAGGILGGMNVAALHASRVDRDIRSLRAKGYLANVFGEVGPGWRGVTGAIKGLGRITALTETGTRLGLYRGAYERAVRDGLSEYDASVEAAYIATDYIDFGLNGSGTLHARRLVPFLNAQLQGLYKMFRTLGGDDVARRKGLAFALGAYFKNTNNLPLSRLEKQQLNTGRAAWLKMLSLGFIGAALWAIFKDNEDYQEASEYLRTTGWVIPTGDGKIAYIPKPFELAVLSNVIERGLEAATGDSTAMDRFLRGVAFTMTPPTAPPAVQTAIEAGFNIDFFSGRPIVPEYMQALRPELQYDNYTSSFAKWLGGATGQSPMVVDHILSNMGASAYRDLSTMLNAADPTRPTPDETELPILRRFVRDVRRGSASAQDFWAQASNTNGKLARAAATYKHYMEAGNTPAANRFLGTVSADERAYAVLMTDFKAEYKRLEPFYRARQVTTVVSAMRRENGSELGLGDTSTEPVPGEVPPSFTMTRQQRAQVDDLLSEVARREVRNTLIATGQPGWVGKEVLPLQPTLDMLLTVSPDTYDEYVRRSQKAKIYDAQTVYEYWPEVRDRLNQDGPDAVLDDAVAIASAGVVF